MSTSKYDPIFEPIKIGNVKIKNRIAMAPMNMNYTGPQHYVSDQQLAHFAARAKGGTGLIITDAVFGVWHPTADTYRKYNNMRLDNELFLSGMSELAEHVHAFGAKIFVQMAVGPGRQGTSEMGAVQPVSASPIPYKTYPENLINGIEPFSMLRALGYQGELPVTDDIDELLSFANKVPGTHMNGETPREITVVEIQELVKEIGVGAKLAKRAGFDGVELHACHGYLIHSFFSHRSNRRTDQYGGSFENRIRFLLECVRSMRKYVGPDYAIGVRISASDNLPEGFDEHFTKRVAKRCEEEGVNYVHLSDGSYEKMNNFLPNEEAISIDKAAVINQGLNIPLICPSVHNPDNVVDALTKGKADMISIGRGLIADPDWVSKVKEGRIKDIIKCTRCNKGCISRFALGLPCRCILNPIVGQERFIDEYMRRPILSIKQRVWQTLAEIGKEPSIPIKGIRPEDL
ncbi:MAG: NADH:flavin oxidoreductase [Syntrophales bacterium]|jgi:2,4-dienoyl-CoA reductase-like NADH-dependent reductase (Old Yellow Enzyme family)